MVEDVELEGFPARLQELIGEDSVSRFALEVGLGDNLIRKYLAGATPGLDKVVRICQAKGVNIAWLALGKGGPYDDEMPGLKAAAYRPRRRIGDTLVAEPRAEMAETLQAIDGREFVLVPRYDIKVSAGNGSVIHSEQIVDYYAFQLEWFAREVGISPASAACAEVRGNSMEPDLFDGEIVIMDTSKNRFVDDAIYILHYGDALRIKKVHTRIDGTVEIRSSNEAYKSEVLTPEEAERITIIGRARRAIPPVRRLP